MFLTLGTIAAVAAVSFTVGFAATFAITAGAWSRIVRQRRALRTAPPREVSRIVGPADACYVQTWPDGSRICIRETHIGRPCYRGEL